MIKGLDIIGCVADGWRVVERPGYFGRRRDMRIAAFNADHGEGQWKLAWYGPKGGGSHFHTFESACKHFYEASYTLWFYKNLEEVDTICTYGECIDNAPTNVQSGLDYAKQEAFSTHIQDIAVRNVLATLGRKFEGPKDKILVIRSKDSEGYKYGPGNIPFFDADFILQPSKCPSWSKEGTVEDFWQSNKVLMVKTAEFRGEFG